MSITARRLRELRKGRHMSQTEVANHLGITRTAYNKYESGKTRPVRRLNELANLYGVSTDYILGREELLLAQNMRNMSDKSTRQLQKYLELSDTGKDIVDITLDAVYMEEEYGIHLTEDETKELKKMCNLSEGVYNSGFDDGVNVGTRNKAKEDLQNLIESTGWSLEKAMQALRIPLEERDHYEKALKKQH